MTLALGPTRRAEAVMGTVVSFDVRADLPPPVVEAAIDAAVETLRAIEARLSPFLETSDVSRIGRGELREAEAHPDVRLVLERCEELRLASRGAFDARRHRADGRFDPSGYVKGWAIEVAAGSLRSAGLRDFMVNAGGDILAVGEPEPGRPWRVGIRHPGDPHRLVAVLAVRDLAVATSGAYERGDHIRDPRTGLAPRELGSVTVVGPIPGWADGLATAAFVMGHPGLAWVAAQPGYGALSATAEGGLAWTAAFEALRA